MRRTISSACIKSVSDKKENHNDTALMVIVIIILILGLFGAIAYPSTLTRVASSDSLNSLDSGCSSYANISPTFAMAVVPEPATLAMLAFSGVTTMMMLGHKRFR